MTLITSAIVDPEKVWIDFAKHASSPPLAVALVRNKTEQAAIRMNVESVNRSAFNRINGAINSDLGLGFDHTRQVIENVLASQLSFVEHAAQLTVDLAL